MALLGGVLSHFHVHAEDGDHRVAPCGHPHPEQEGSSLLRGDPCGLCVVGTAVTGVVPIPPPALGRGRLPVPEIAVSWSQPAAVPVPTPGAIRGPPAAR